MKRGLFICLLIAGVTLASCSENFRKKFALAKELSSDLGATGYKLGTETTTEDGRRKKTMKLTYSGIHPDNWDETGLHMACNYVAYKFVTKLTPQEFGTDSVISVRAEMTDGNYFEYDFPVARLREEGQFFPVSEQFVNACMTRDTLSVRDLCDEQLIPDSLLANFYGIFDYNDSVYGGETPARTMKGFYYATADSYEGLELHSTLYYVETPQWLTRYVLNIDRKTKKVVYVSINSEPKQ